MDVPVGASYHQDMGRMLSTKQPPTMGTSRPAPSVQATANPDVNLQRPKFIPPLPEETSGLRRLAFYFCLACIFLRFSFLSEALASSVGNTYLIYFAAPFAIVGSFATGGWQRTFRSKAAVFLLLFFIWMAIAAIFSSWRGGSFERVRSYGQNELFMLIVVGGLVVGWKEIRLVFHTLALSGLVVLIVARVFLRSDGGRFSLDFAGTIANANDLATHVLLLLPFMLYVVMDKKAMFLMRLLYAAAIPYSLYIVLGTASRGCLLGLAGGALFWFLRAPMKQKMLAVILLPMLLVPALALLPKQTFDRLNTLSGKRNEEADESAASRSYLFYKGVEFTLQRPLFGVGPDQFANFEGASSRAAGQHGNWHQTHCTWVQISSECGIPALLFFLLAVGGAFFMVNKCYKQARRLKNDEIANACFCYMLASVFFYISITFLSNGYTFRQPAFIGLAIAMFFAMQRMMFVNATHQRNLAAVPVQVESPRLRLAAD